METSQEVYDRIYPKNEDGSLKVCMICPECNGNNTVKGVQCSLCEGRGWVNRKDLPGHVFHG